MIEVWVQAAVEVSTTKISSLSSVPPSTRSPSADSTSVEWLARKPGPATDWPAIDTSTNVTSRIRVETTAALPGPWRLSWDSSLTVTQASQPQQTKTPRGTP